MRRIKALISTLAVVAFTATLIGCGGGSNSAAASRGDHSDHAGTPTARTSTPTSKETETTKERGHVIECTGTHRGQDVWVSLYENNTFVNVIQVVVGDNGTGNSREVKEGFVNKGEVHGTLRLKGKKLTVAGTAKRVGPRIPVHEEHDDAGQHVVEDGYHRSLRTDLSMTWMNRTASLGCDNAFFYKLTVTKTDTAND